MKLTLPWPPSVNTYWRNLNGRTLISQDGRAYRANAYAAVTEQAPGRLRGRVRVSILTHQPDRRRRDLDNLPKAVLDALTFASVIEYDSLIDDLRITRGPVDRANPRLILTLEAL